MTPCWNGANCIEGEEIMARTSSPMAAAAMAEASAVSPAEAPAVSPAEARRRPEQDPETLVVDVRDAADLAGAGVIPGAANASLGALTYKADHEVDAAWRDPRFADVNRPILVTCELGPLAALGANLLKDMGYSNVAFIVGGAQGWKDAGLPTAPASDVT
jgi:rhodanese-related sulfurtransferase